ncbi:MAG: BlaI/MecI/CopY family transcriptional regulator [Planctomycetota bacterium]|jgi:predicted transcriptional regulator
MRTKKPVPLSAAQREIMEIVWDQGEISAFELREILSKRRPLARETVRTLLRRMEQKGWLEHRVVGRTYFYFAAIPRELNLGHRVLHLVDEMCGGSPERLMSALLDHRGLTDEEADRIGQMIEAARRKKTRRKGTS